MEASPSAGGKAGGRVVSGKNSVRFSPYARPVSGSGSRPSRASGLSTPGLPPSAMPNTAGFARQSRHQAPQQPATGTPSTPSTFNRILTPFKAASGFFLGTVGSLLGSGSSPGSQSVPSPGAAPNRVDRGVTDRLHAPSNEDPCGNGFDGPEELEEPELSLDPTGLPSNEDPQETASSGGSLLASLKQSPLRSIHGYPLYRVDHGQNHGAVPPLLGSSAGDTPYSSVLELLREGPSRSHRLQQSTGYPEAPHASHSASGRGYHTPAISTHTPRGLPPRGDGLFTMGMTPTTGIGARHRSSVRSAFAKRAPDSATPMLTFAERGVSSASPGTLQNGTGPTTSAPVWTPMRRSTMAMVEHYDKKDATSAKRSRQSPPTSHEGTPLVGSGISSLRSFAIQSSAYRRRVRPRNEPAALPQPAPAPASEQPTSAEDTATPKTKLTTETARRILMTLDSLATKPSPSPPASRPVVVSATTSRAKQPEASPGLSLSQPAQDKRGSVKSRLTLVGPPEAGIDASPKAKDTPSSIVTLGSSNTQEAAAPASGGWGAAFLQANAASSTAAAKAAAEEIAKQSGASSSPAKPSGLFSFGAPKAAPAASADATEPPKPPTSGFTLGKQPVHPGGKGPAVLPEKSETSPPATAVFSFPASNTAALSKPSISFSVPVACASSPTTSLEPAIKSGGNDTLKPVQKRVSFAPETKVLAVTPQSAPQAVFAGKPAIKGTPVPPGILSVDKPFGGQSPIFSFGGPRNTKEEAAIKDATAGYNPQGPEPVFLFGAAAAPEASPPPAVHMPLSKEVQELAEKTVKEAAAMPLPDEEDEDEPDVGFKSGQPTPTPPPASGGWGAAFLASNAAAAKDTAAAIQKEIEEKKASPGAKDLSFGLGSTPADKPTTPLFSASAAESPPTVTGAGIPAGTGSAATVSGWGAAFLEQNKLAHSAAMKAVENEIEKSAAPPPSTAVTFKFGSNQANATPAVKASDTPPTSETTPAASGWGAGFLAANQAHASKATAAAEEAIKEASQGAASQPFLSTPAPAFSFGALPAADSAAVTALNAAGTGSPTGVFSSVSQPASTPAPTFSFGAAASSDAGADASAASAPLFAFGATNSAAGPSPSFSFGASTASSAAAPLFGSSGAAAAPMPAPTPAPAFGASTAAPGFGSAAVAVTPAAFGSASTSAPAFGVAGACESKDSEQPPTDAAASNPFGATPTAPTFSFGSSSTGATVGMSTATPSAPFGASTTPSFGGTTPAVPGFGAVTSGGIAPTPAAPSFGASTPQVGFGAAPVAFGSAASAPGFGAAPVPSSAPSFAFGASSAPAEAAPPSAFAFGASSATPAPATMPAPASFGGGFGPQQPQTPAPGFGGPPAAAGFSFGASAGSAPSFGAQPAAFGQQQPAPAFGGAVPGAAAPSFAFGAAAQPQAAASAFGGQPSAAAPGGFTMGGGETQQGARRVVKVRRNRRGR